MMKVRKFQIQRIQTHFPESIHQIAYAVDVLPVLREIKVVLLLLDMVNVEKVKKIDKNLPNEAFKNDDQRWLE